MSCRTRGNVLYRVHVGHSHMRSSPGQLGGSDHRPLLRQNAASEIEKATVSTGQHRLRKRISRTPSRQDSPSRQESVGSNYPTQTAPQRPSIAPGPHSYDLARSGTLHFELPRGASVLTVARRHTIQLFVFPEPLTGWAEHDLVQHFEVWASRNRLKSPGSIVRYHEPYPTAGRAGYDLRHQYVGRNVRMLRTFGLFGVQIHEYRRHDSWPSTLMLNLTPGQAWPVEAIVE